MKHTAKLQEWSLRITECRTSGMPVKSWCKSQGISVKTYYYWERNCLAETVHRGMLSKPKPSGMLMRVNPQTMPDDEITCSGALHGEAGIVVRHGASTITLPTGYPAAAIADLVKALNSHV